jgi:hypothetical protein
MIVQSIIIFLIVAIVFNLILYLTNITCGGTHNRIKHITNQDVAALATINIKPTSKKSYGEDVLIDNTLNDLDYYEVGYDVVDKRPEFTMADIVEKNHILGRTSSSHVDNLNIEVEVQSRPMGSRTACRRTERDGYCNK